MRGTSVRWVMTAACAAWLWQIAAATAAVTLKEADNHIAVTIDGASFTDYWFGPRADRPYVRPFFDPVRAADGTPVTSDQYTLKGSDHPHHQSMWISQGDVNGVDHWALHGKDSAREQHLRFERVNGDTIIEDLDWQTADGKPMLHERRTMRFFPVGATARGIDFALQFTPDAGPVTFGDTKEAGLIAIRVASAISKHPTITNSTRAHGEAATWGKPANWCDISGNIEGRSYGITAFDAPTNPRHPTRWHVREYGLMAANPFGISFFDKGAPRHAGDFRMEVGKPVTFRYRVIVHEGPLVPGTADAQYREFAGVTR